MKDPEAMHYRCAALTIPLCLLGGVLRARAAEPALRTPPRVTAVHVETPPKIDGVLDDACWAQAARLEGFFVPGLERPLPEETIGLICADDQALYVAVICKDRTPEDIKAVETRRNGEIWRDDYVCLDLDPAHAHQSTYSFYVTARGTQCEDIPGGSATKIEWRGDWRAAAARTPEGYVVEMAVPFSILRCPPHQTTFGLSLSRYLPEESVGVAYPDMGKVWNQNLTADLVGLRPPAFVPRPVLMPFTVFDFGDTAGRAFDSGLDVQYKLQNGLTALGSHNPDFSQIEQVVEPISFSYTERRLPEVRPFFTTGGSEEFFPKFHLFYSPRIADFDTGLKLFGRVGQDQIGILDVLAYGGENSFVAAWRHFPIPDEMRAFYVVHHQQIGQPDNLVYSFDYRHTWRRPEGQDDLWAVTYQSVGQDADGSVYSVGGSHDLGQGRLHYGWMTRYSTPNFRPALGYWWDNDNYGASFDLGKYYRDEQSLLRYRSWSFSASYYPYVHQSGIEYSHLGADYDWSWRNGRFFSCGYEQGREYNQETSDHHASYGWNNRDMYREGDLFVLVGLRSGGDYRYASLSQGFRPWKSVSVRTALEYGSLAPPSPDAYHAYQAVVTTSYDLTTEKSMAVRLIARDAGVTVYAAYRQVVRRGLDAYLIIGDPDPVKTGFARRVALKLIRVL